MANQYTQEELWKLYKTLPEQLQEAIFSEETANHIGSACTKNQVPGNLVPRVAAQVGDVLLGLVRPEDFQKNLEKEIGLKKAATQGITQELNRFIFYPLRSTIDSLHKIGNAENSAIKEQPIKVTSTSDANINTEQSQETIKKIKHSGPDPYREPTEE
ncbi:MAG: hypothetical protein HYV77_02105 [Candidatus Wildermuthbacteria bacterium]|nr:hypothetical protein [Candidatus Wildermuthbacteria bacterium]